jgi:hypothetical protein
MRYIGGDSSTSKVDRRKKRSGNGRTRIVLVGKAGR